MSPSEPSGDPAPVDVAGLFTAMFDRVTAKDLPGVLGMFTDDALLFDPHYPEVRMLGKPAIERGLRWGMGGIESFGFDIRKVWSDGTSGVAELDTHHVIRGRLTTEFDQVFVMETRDGLITRLQSYVPYTSHGIGGMFRRVNRFGWRLRGRKLSRVTTTALKG